MRSRWCCRRCSAPEWATPLAAIGIAVVSLMAAGFHVRAGEWIPTLETVFLAALAGAVAIGRGEAAPSAPSDVLVAAIALLVPAIVIVLVVLTRSPVAPPTERRGV